VVGDAFATALLDEAIHVRSREATQLEVVTEHAGEVTDLGLVDGEGGVGDRSAFDITSCPLAKENEGIVHRGLARGCVSRISGITFELAEDDLGGAAIGAARRSLTPLAVARVVPAPPGRAFFSLVEPTSLLH